MQSANWKINHTVRYCVVDDIETFLFHATKCVKLEQIAKLPNSQYSTQINQSTIEKSQETAALAY